MVRALINLALGLTLFSINVSAQFNQRCNADNCLRAITGTRPANPTRPGPTSRIADCSSFQMISVIPPATTTTVNNGQPTGTSVTSQDTTVRPSSVPGYASCGANSATRSSRYASACSCAGVTQNTQQAPTPTSTVACPPTMPSACASSDGTTTCKTTCDNGLPRICKADGDPCLNTAECCQGTECVASTEQRKLARRGVIPMLGTCQVPPTCAAAGQQCTGDGDCCNDNECMFPQQVRKVAAKLIAPAPTGTCQAPPPPCQTNGFSCSSNANCCSNFCNSQQICADRPQNCDPVNYFPCYSNTACCSGNCVNYQCKAAD